MKKNKNFDIFSNNSWIGIFFKFLSSRDKRSKYRRCWVVSNKTV